MEIVGFAVVLVPLVLLGMALMRLVRRQRRAPVDPEVIARHVASLPHYRPATPPPPRSGGDPAGDRVGRSPRRPSGSGAVARPLPD